MFRRNKRKLDFFVTDSRHSDGLRKSLSLLSGRNTLEAQKTADELLGMSAAGAPNHRSFSRMLLDAVLGYQEYF